MSGKPEDGTIHDPFDVSGPDAAKVVPHGAGAGAHSGNGGVPVTAVVTEEQVKKAEEENRLPRCGFCGMDPLKIHIDDTRNPINRTIMVTRTVMCQNCRAALSVTVLGVERMMTDPRTPPKASTVRYM